MENINEEYEQKIKELIQNFINYTKENKLTKDNKEAYTQIIKDYIYKLIRLKGENIGFECEISNKELSDEEIEQYKNNTIILKFFSSSKSINSATHLVLKNDDSITIAEIEINLDDIYLDLNKNKELTRIKKAEEITKIVFHELRHYEQELLLSTGISNNSLMKIAKEQILTQYLEEKWYNKNYCKLLIEIDAEKSALENINMINGQYNENLKILEEIEYFSKYKLKNESEDGEIKIKSKYREILREKAQEEILDYLICDLKEEEILTYFPYLKKVYNSDCTKKSVNELILNMKEEIYEIIKNGVLSPEEKDILIKDAEEMYYELIYAQLNKMTYSELDIMTNQGIDIEKLLNKIKKYYLNFQENFGEHQEEAVNYIEKFLEKIDDNKLNNKEDIILNDDKKEIKILETRYGKKCKNEEKSL